MDSNSYYEEEDHYVTELADMGFSTEEVEAVGRYGRFIVERAVNSAFATKVVMRSDTGEMERAVNAVRVELLKSVADLHAAMRNQAISIISFVTGIGVIFRLFA